MTVPETDDVCEVEAHPVLVADVEPVAEKHVVPDGDEETLNDTVNDGVLLAH